MHISIMDLQGKEQGNRSCDHQSARKIMPVFPIEFTAQSTIHQRQIIQVEADSIEDAIEAVQRSEEHTSELQSLMRISYAVFCLKKNKNNNNITSANKNNKQDT